MRYVYKLIALPGAADSGKVSIDALWSRYFGLGEEERKNASTGRAHLGSKDELRTVLEHMEASDYCMVDGDDVILMKGD